MNRTLRRLRADFPGIVELQAALEKELDIELLVSYLTLSQPMLPPDSHR
ncbi:hypothetical protein [Kitasatospora sp. NPDC127116]